MHVKLVSSEAFFSPKCSKEQISFSGRALPGLTALPIPLAGLRGPISNGMGGKGEAERG